MDKCVQMLDKELWRLGPDGLGVYWRRGERSPARDGENMRGEPWLERTGREKKKTWSEIGVERKERR
ncbi:hypothetical protein TNCV_3564291 [Trichonephila clavipes]|nr:hypothetical protein TNCV_3564291 [Trichonephila clavipes]